MDITRPKTSIRVIDKRALVKRNDRVKFVCTALLQVHRCGNNKTSQELLKCGRS